MLTFRRRTLTVFVLCAGPLAIAALLAQDPPAVAVEKLPSPAGPNAMAPQLTVTGPRAILSWLERGEPPALKFAERTPTGWSPARTVVTSHTLIVNAADVPGVRLMPDGSLLANWPEENGDDPEASTLRVSASRDDGRTWSTPTTPYSDASPTQHSFALSFSLPGSAPGGGRTGVAWLDGRKEGSMAVRAAVYGADERAAVDTVVDERVCECCPMAIAQGADGPLMVFRNRTEAEVRDIYISRFEGGRWSAATAVHRDGWTIDACPVNGPAISASGRNVAVAWFTGAGGKGHALVAFSSDHGRTFAAPVRVDEQESLGHVTVDWVDANSAAVGWIEFTSAGSLFQVRQVGRAGARGRAVTIAESGRSQYPRLARAGGELIFAWTESTRGTTALRTARAPLPSAPAGNRKP
jgi:hypothetical protein